MRRFIAAGLCFACLGLGVGAFGKTKSSANLGISRVAGKYRTNFGYSPPTHLTLEKTGKFTLTTFCVLSDIVIEDTSLSSGTFAMDGPWITLTYQEATAPACDRINKLYVIEQDGTLLLFPELLLASITNELNTNFKHVPVFPLRLDGKRERFDADPRQWLPTPYATSVKLAQINGKILSIGPTAEHVVFAPGSPTYQWARLTLDIGTRDGVYEGMKICLPAGRAFSIDSVQQHQSTVIWTWYEKGAAPVQVGMGLTSLCPK